ncbi:phage terminase large subunit family protein [uncultured Acidaminococcus sp.]|uniref:phage terminase large subunit family protein n=1 Tax=uncultured Acidaminococcus sp. TaxID=352152 RepID=UPI0026DC8C4C|nr:terminase gpA endonuclease subunit [uncultured Acidaminococcus sp.]
MKQKTIKLFQGIASNALRPLPSLTVSDWADSYRMLSSESSSEPGRWHTDRAPYQKDIMDAFTSVGVRKVVVMSCSQVGKSDIMMNVIGRFAHLAPAPILMIQPTIEMAQDFSKSRIAPMIRDTKVLKDIFRDIKSRDAGNTILSKLFPGGRLIMGGANSPAGLASRPIKILLADEVDRFPDSAGTEGDPVDLAAKRMTTFWDRVMGLFSTPTIAGQSRIAAEYMAGTQEEWQHRCPNCGEYHLLTHRDMEVQTEEVEDQKGRPHKHVKSVTWRCPDCGFGFTEAQMREAKQKYIPRNPTALQTGTRSFFVNCWASPWLSWLGVMQEWSDAKGDPEREKVVVNTRFGEPYEREINTTAVDTLLARREDYDAELPDGVLLLTAAVDTQDNRLEYEIVGWGAEEECWGIKKGVLPGIPDSPALWDQLDEQLDRKYYFKDGETGLRVARTFIDSGGHYGRSVAAYCYSHRYRQRFAIMGHNVPGVDLIHKYSKKAVTPGKTVALVMVGVDSGKQYVMDRIAIEAPGPKYFHFPRDQKGSTNLLQANRGYDCIYFRGLLAEEKRAKKKNGRVIWSWENVAKDKRNEPLDLRVYNLAALASINPDFEKIKEALRGEPPERTWKQRSKPKYGVIKKGVI